MNEKPTSEVNEDSGYDSRDCVNVFFDGPSDTTVRPCSAKMLPILQAEREKLIKWGGWIAGETPGNDLGTSNSGTPSR